MFEQAYESILKQLAEMPEFLRRVAAELHERDLDRLPSHDKSNLREHLWHIRDCEIDLYSWRIYRTLEEDEPSLEPVDVNAWPSSRGYSKWPAGRAIAEFIEARCQLVRQLRMLKEPQLSRVAARADGTRTNVLTLVEELLEHDRDHRWRIAAVFRSFAKQEGLA